MHQTILIVDDNKEFSILVEYAFQKQVEEKEFVLLFAKNGLEALDMIEEHPEIHLVVTDVSMPEMDGLTMLERMNEHNPHIKSIVISGYSNMEYIRRAMNAGASDYLIKPVSLGDLEESIIKTMNKVDVVRDALRSRDRLMQLERDLVIAGEIQRAMLPQRYPAFPDRAEFDIAAALMPAREVGGDFYDFFMIEDNYLGFVIGDVTGKGIPAALLMALTRTLIRSYAMQGKPANETMSLVNNTLAIDNKLAMFATTFFGVMEVSSGIVEYCNAAHVPPVVLRANGTLEPCEGMGGMALGMLENMPYKVDKLQLRKGDSLVIFTDGITDASNAEREMFGMPRIIDTLQGQHIHNANTIMMNMLETVTKYAGNEEQTDDIAVQIIKYTKS